MINLGQSAEISPHFDIKAVFFPHWFVVIILYYIYSDLMCLKRKHEKVQQGANTF